MNLWTNYLKYLFYSIKLYSYSLWYGLWLVGVVTFFEESGGYFIGELAVYLNWGCSFLPDCADDVIFKICTPGLLGYTNIWEF